MRSESGFLDLAAAVVRRAVADRHLERLSPAEVRSLETTYRFDRNLSSADATDPDDVIRWLQEDAQCFLDRIDPHGIEQSVKRMFNDADCPPAEVAA